MSRPLDIVGIGVSVWDTIMLVDALPKPGSVVQSKRRIEGIGGGITVAMATAARLGSRTALIDSLGDDVAGSRIVETLSREGVDTSGSIRQGGKTSSIASIWSETQSAERTIVYSPGSACELLHWTPHMEQLVSQTQLLHFNGRHPEVCRRAIRVAKEHRVKISFDGGAYRYRAQILPMLAAADIVIVARQFAESHFATQFGSDRTLAPMQLAEFLMQELRCEIAGVTDGADGSFLVERTGGRFHQPAISPEKAIDTTGCGDTYHGAFLHAYAQGNTTRRAAQLAAGVASDNTRALGGLAFGESASGLTRDRPTSP